MPGLEALQDEGSIYCGGDRRAAEEPTVRPRHLGVGRASWRCLPQGDHRCPQAGLAQLRRDQLRARRDGQVPHPVAKWSCGLGMGTIP